MDDLKEQKEDCVLVLSGKPCSTEQTRNIENCALTHLNTIRYSNKQVVF